MELAIFDLDNTLIGGDSDHAWGQFLVEKGVVDKDSYQQANDRFYEEYKRGEFDILAYLSFALAPLAALDIDRLNTLHNTFMTEKIEPILLPKAFELIEQHQRQGHKTIIITATNRFVTAPIAERLGIDTLLATEPEVVMGTYTGKVSGEPCYHEGKVLRLNTWLAEQSYEPKQSYFYSDSFTDIPLLEYVTHPHAVDPDDRLKTYATRQQWPILSLR